MIWSTTWLSCLCFTSIASLAIDSYGLELEGHKVIRIQNVVRENLADLSVLDLDIWSHDLVKGDVVAHVSPEEYLLLLQFNEFNVKVIVPNIRSQVLCESRMASMQSKQKNKGDWFSEYHRYGEIKSWYEKLASEHQKYVKMVPRIGKSHQGRDIFAIHINLTPPRADKKQIWIQGLIHAREWISGAVVQYLSFQLVTADLNDLPEGMKDIEYIIVPIVNPDGYEYTWTTNRLWRKNMAPLMLGRGVDLNRNFDDHWGEGGASNFPVSETYQGPSAASEPETQAIQKYLGKQHNIVGAIDWHCYSQLILYPYGWTGEKIVNQNDYLDLTERMVKAFKLNGRTYVAQQSSDLYPTSGSMSDWVVGKNAMLTNNYRPFSLAIELPPSLAEGTGFLLNPKYIIPTGKESWEAFIEFVKYSEKHAPKAFAPQVRI